MSGVLCDLIHLNRLRNIDSHRHVLVASSKLSYTSEDWRKRVDDAYERGELPPDLTHDDVEFVVKYCEQNSGEDSRLCGGNIVQLSHDFLNAIKSIAEYLKFGT